MWLVLAAAAASVSPSPSPSPTVPPAMLRAIVRASGDDATDEEAGDPHLLEQKAWKVVPGASVVLVKHGETLCVAIVKSGAVVAAAQMAAGEPEGEIGPFSEVAPRLDLAPYRVATGVFAIGVRRYSSSSYAAGGYSSDEWLTLLSWKDGKLTRVATTMMGSSGESRGDYLPDGDRPMVDTWSDATLSVLSVTTNGHFVLKKKWKGNGAPGDVETLRWKDGGYASDGQFDESPFGD